MSDKCDCLVYCGDDPWLKDGRSKPCAQKVQKEEERRLAIEAMNREKKDAARYRWLRDAAVNSNDEFLPVVIRGAGGVSGQYFNEALSGVALDTAVDVAIYKIPPAGSD